MIVSTLCKRIVPKVMSNFHTKLTNNPHFFCLKYKIKIKEMPDKKKVLFICLGNICRSPIAEAVFIDLVKKEKIEDDWEIDSAAIGSWHVGKNPDSRAVATMKKHNLAYSNKARQIKTPDFNKFDYIFGMDDDNIEDLNRLAPKDGTAKILLLGDFDPEGVRIIRDPYYDSDAKGFEKCYEQSIRCCTGFLQQIKENKI